VPLSAAEKQRRYRERKNAADEARFRYDRGLPDPPPEPVAPEGAYLTPGGDARPKFGHFDAGDGTFPPIPDGIKAETMTTADGDVIPLEDYQQKLRAQEVPRRDDTAIWDAWWRESS
jgi:hypothetical protein